MISIFSTAVTEFLQGPWEALRSSEPTSDEVVLFRQWGFGLIDEGEAFLDIAAQAADYRTGSNLAALIVKDEIGPIKRRMAEQLMSETHIGSGTAPSGPSQTASTPSASTPKRKRLRGYDHTDEPLLQEMRALISEKKANSPSNAAAQIAHKAAGSDANRVRRLADKYNEKFK